MHPVIQIGGGIMVLVFGAGSLAAMETSVELFDQKVYLAPWVALLGTTLIMHGIVRQNSEGGVAHYA